MGPARVVGKRKVFYGAWMRDAKARPGRADGRWVAEHFEGTSLLQFPSEGALAKGPFPFLLLWQLFVLLQG